jgi:hypothetical protein
VHGNAKVASVLRKKAEEAIDAVERSSQCACHFLCARCLRQRSGAALLFRPQPYAQRCRICVVRRASRFRQPQIAPSSSFAAVGAFILQPSIWSPYRALQGHQREPCVHWRFLHTASMILAHGIVCAGAGTLRDDVAGDSAILKGRLQEPCLQDTIDEQAFVEDKGLLQEPCLQDTIDEQAFVEETLHGMLDESQ